MNERMAAGRAGGAELVMAAFEDELEQWRIFSESAAGFEKHP
jgi:hypothetical protein